MEKWEQAIRQTVNPSVPSGIEDRIKHTLAQLPRRERRVRMFLALPAAILAAFVLLGMTAMSPALADTLRSIPVIGSIFEKVGNVGERKASQAGLASPLGQQVTLNGQTLTFTESLYDGSGIHIGYIKGSDKLDLLNEAQVSIDGKRLNYTGDTSGRTLEDGEFAGIMTIYPEQELPDSFTLELSYPGSGDQAWHVEIPMTLQGDQRAYLINEPRQWYDKTLIFDKIVNTPSSTALYVRWLVDHKGAGMDAIMNYQIFDDKGRALQLLGSDAQETPADNGQYVVSVRYLFEPLDSVPASLTVKPYLGNPMAGSEERRPWMGEGFELSQGEAGSLKIVKVDQQDHTLTLTYEVEGELTYQRAFGVWVENKEGQRYEKIRDPHRVEGTVNQYQASFVSPNLQDDVVIGTYTFRPIEYLENMAVTVDLNP